MTTNVTLEDKTEDFNIEDLNESQFELGDLASAPLYKVKTGESSNKQLATNTALLNEDAAQAAEAFQGISEELSVTGTREKQQAVVDDARKASFGDIQDSLVNVLLDENLDDESKERAAKYALDKTSDLFSVRKQLTTKELAKPLASTNMETERVRGNFSEIVDEVNDYLESKQNLLNQRAAAVNNSTSASVVEFLEAMLPFSRQKLIGDIASDLKDNLGEESGLDTNRFKSFFMLGESFEAIQDTIRSVPHTERHKITQMLADIIDDNDEIVIPDENGFAKVDLLRTFLEEGYYEESDKWVDNVIGILDMFLLGGVAKQVARGAKNVSKTRTLDDIVADLRSKRTFQGDFSYTSAGRNAEQANPDTARIIFDSSTSSDEVASAMYGAASADVAARGLNPKPMVKGAKVEAQPSQMGRNQDVELSGDPELLDYSKRDGRLYYTANQKREMRSQVFYDFEHANGLTLRENVTQVGRDDSDILSIKAVYAPSPNSGWESVEDAVNQTMFGLRKYGVTEDDVEILVRSNDEYVPLGESEGLPTVQDYVISVKYNYEYNPLDVQSFEKVDVNLNLFDRTIGRAEFGQHINLTRMMKDPTSLFDPTISNAALRAEDRSAAIEKELVTLAKVFDETYLSLPKNSQIKINEYVFEANANGIPFSPDKLKGMGFNTQEIKSLKEWKDYWDTIYLLENSDMTNKLTSQGWELWNRGESTLITRPLARNRIGDNRTFYDGAEDSVKRYSDDDLAKLYEDGGSVVELRTPVEIDGKTVTQMVVPQNSDSFTRRLREEDRILNYRHGYYAVKYKTPWFIDKLDDNGDVLETVATAGNIKDAQKFADRMGKTEGTKFVVRADRASNRTIEDDYIEVNISQGRSAQRFRGKRLRDASGTTDVDHKHVKDPVESMIDSARNISNRISYRDYLETNKRRFVDNYKAVLPKTKGQYSYPNNINEIVDNGDVKNAKLVQEAKQTWEYLNYLQNAYINGIDEFYKARIREAATLLGSKSSKGEEALMWLGDKNPTGFAKNLAFQTLLAHNPLRQFVVQGHQAVQLSAIEPLFVATQLARQSGAMLSYKLGQKNIAAKAFGVSRKEMDLIVKTFDDSGLVANVDRHALIQGSLTQMADSWSVGNKAQRVAVKIMSFPRKVGFDAGENVNMVTAWLTMRHRAIKQGKDMSRTDVQAEVAALARDFTYSMNFAGDQPYNQNAVAALFQFMQAPHKAMLQVTSNRNLTKVEKSKLLSFNAVMYSLPPVVFYTTFGGLLSQIEDEEIRDGVVFGLESYMFNALLSGITGENPRLDFSSLAPSDMYGFYELLSTFWTDGSGEAIANTPAASMLIGHSPRLTDAFKQAMRYFYIIEDQQERPEDFMEVVKSGLSVSSGYSNFMKASYAWQTGNKISSSGKISAENVSGTQAVAAAFGIPLQSETQTYITSKISYGKSEEFREDVRKWYGELKRIAAKQGIPNESSEFEFRVHNSLLMHFREYPEEFNRQVMQMLVRDLQDRDFSLYQNAQRNMGMMTNEEFRSWVQSAPMKEEIRKELMSTMDLLDRLRKEDN